MPASSDPSSGLDLDIAWQRFSDGLRAYFLRRVRQAADADDLVQQVFLKVAKAPPQDLPEERLGRWLYRVARNALIDARRRATVRRTDVLDPETAAQANDDSWLALARCLEPLIRTLPPTYAEALRRSDLEGVSQRAMADELGLSHSAMKSRVQRGRIMLREKLVACCQPDEAADCGTCDDEASCA